MTIKTKWTCDACGKDVETPRSSVPDRWETVRVVVSFGENEEEAIFHACSTNCIRRSVKMAAGSLAERIGNPTETKEDI